MEDERILIFRIQMRMKQLLLLLFSLATLSSFAYNVTLEESRNVAIKFWASIEPQTRNLDASKLVLIADSEYFKSGTSGDSAPAFYIFNRTESQGFVIISGEDTTQPILAYSSTGTFATEQLPENVLYWLREYRDQILLLRQTDPAFDEHIASLWQHPGRALTRASGKQMETAKWNQDAPYNYYSPTILGKKTVTGCVATAMAIIMRYKKWPDVGEGSHRYYAETYADYLEATFNVKYDWTGMPLEYIEGQYTDEQAQKVGMLMFHCGVAAEMDFTYESSGAFTQEAVGNMVNFFKYDKSVTIPQRDWYELDTWNQLMKNEIDQDRPVMYGGADSQGAHQFVLDGYDENDMFHVNWGWGGLCDGFYLLSALNPAQQGIGGYGSYNQGQSAVIGLQKAEESSAYHDLLGFIRSASSDGRVYMGLSTNATSYETGKGFLLNAAFIANYSIRDFEGSLVPALVDKNGKVKEYISDIMETEEPILIGYAAGRLNIECLITQNIAPGDRIWMMYKSKDADTWYRIMGSKKVISEIIVKEDDPTGIEDPVEKVTFSAFCDRNGLLVACLPEGVERLSIYSVDGRLLKTYIPESNGEQKWQVSCSELPTGVYILQAATEQQLYQCKFIK